MVIGDVELPPADGERTPDCGMDVLLSLSMLRIL
jgi:hypothetical protein